jgi:DNA invertase Pin-like site-specific DNA recombinase
MTARKWSTPQNRKEKTTRRDQIIRFVAEYASDHKGNSPTLGEIASKFSISRQAVYTHTLKLSDERRAQWLDGKLCLAGAEFSLPLTHAI